MHLCNQSIQTSMDAPLQRQQQKNMLYGSISILMLLAIILIIGRRVIFWLLGTTKLSGTFIIISESFYWLALLFVWVYSTKIERQKLLLWPEKQYGLWMHIKSILAILGSIIAIAIPVFVILNIFHLEKVSAKGNELRAILQANRPLLLFTALSAGLTEEFIFRGYLLPRFEVLFKNSYSAILVSSVLFGLLHLGYGTVGQVVGPFIIGLVLSVYYWKYRNIAIPIISHFLWDFVSFSLTMKPH